MTPSLAFWHTLPKAELHVHVEAGAPKEFYGALPPWPTLPGGLFQGPASFQSFLNKWFSLVNRLQDTSMVKELARRFVHHQWQQNIFYTEAYISPLDLTWVRSVMPHLPPPLPLLETLQAYCQGVLQGEEELNGAVSVRLIVDALWVSPLEIKRNLLKTMESLLQEGPKGPFGSPIVALGLGGPEVAKGLADMAVLFAQNLPRLGLALDIHSGETATAHTSQEACAHLKPQRVSHGVAPFREGISPSGVTGQLPLAMCPSSNRATGAWPGHLGPHPICHFYGGGLEKYAPATINTDDPLIFETTLAQEYERLAPPAGTAPAWAFYEQALRHAKASAFDKEAWKRVVEKQETAFS